MVKAEEVQRAVLIFLPKENSFFFVNNIELVDNNVTVWFEPDGNPENWVRMKFNNNEELIIVSNFGIIRNNLF